MGKQKSKLVPPTLQPLLIQYLRMNRRYNKFASMCCDLFGGFDCIAGNLDEELEKLDNLILDLLGFPHDRIYCREFILSDVAKKDIKTYLDEMDKHLQKAKRAQRLYDPTAKNPYWKIEQKESKNKENA
jgi:hypothetical protein